MKQNFDFDWLVTKVHQKFETLEEDLNEQIAKVMKYYSDKHEN